MEHDLNIIILETIWRSLKLTAKEEGFNDLVKFIIAHKLRTEPRISLAIAQTGQVSTIKSNQIELNYGTT